MGGAASAQEVGACAASLGPAYGPYSEIFIREGVDGAFIKGLSEDEKMTVLHELGITSTLHSKKLLSELAKVQQGAAGSSEMSLPLGSSAATVIHNVPVLDTITRTPRSLMTELLSIQGIAADPESLRGAVDDIVASIESSDDRGAAADGVDHFHIFISYRVDSDRAVAKEIFFQLKSRGIFAYLDSECLTTSLPWKEGFIRGLKNSHRFLALISSKALARVRSNSQNHAYDNVLIEYETALKIRSLPGQSNFVIPLLLGEYLALGPGQPRVLAKFSEFSESLYPSSIAATEAAAPAAETGPGVDELEDVGRSIYEACKAGNQGKLKTLMATWGSNDIVNWANPDGEVGGTPLIASICSQQIACVKIMLAQPAIDVNKALPSGMSPLMLALQSLDVFKLVASASDVDLNRECTNELGEACSVFVAACLSEKIEEARFLATLPGIDINKACSNGKTLVGGSALSLCYRFGLEDMARFLLTLPGIDPNKCAHHDPEYEDVSVTLPLHFAVHKKDYDFLEMLLALPNIDINRADKIGGYTALHIAVSLKDVDCVRRIASLPGINFSKRDKKHNFTALEHATSFFTMHDEEKAINDEIADTLREHGAK